MLKFKSNTVNGIDVRSYITNKVNSLIGNYECRNISIIQVSDGIFDILSKVLVDTDELDYKITFDSIISKLNLTPLNESTAELFKELGEFHSAV